MKLTQNIAPILDLQLLIDNRIALKEQIEALEAERKEIDAQLHHALVEEGVESRVVGDHKVSLVAIDGRLSIDKMKLLEAGVTTSQIQAATTQGASYIRLDVRKSGKK